MPFVATDDDVKLHYEESGDGLPILFIHEFAGDSRSWGAPGGPLLGSLSLRRL